MRRTRFSKSEHTLPLGSTAWARCEALIAAFEAAWGEGNTPAINDYASLEGPLRRPLLVELVHIDLEFRLKAGYSVRVESYLAEYPDLAANRPAVLDLIEAEYQLRRSNHQSTDLAEYLERFPDLHDELITRLQSTTGGTPDPSGRTDHGAAPRGPVPGYEIVAEIGRGGMGIVYRAREVSLGRDVAMKFLPGEFARDPDRLQRFLREARNASALNHPNICTIHALGEHESRPFIVMELINGQTLKALSKRRPDLLEVVRLIRQAARALAAAHAAGVVHRDIKPENIMVRADGIVKMVDFGLARRLPTLNAADPRADTDTGPGVLMGTAAYMSPEQTRGETVTSASDIFSLGIVFYELATGQHPFMADSALGMLNAIATRMPIAPSRINPTISSSLEGLIEAMLHKDARLRPTAADVESALMADRGTTGQRRQTAPIVHREPELAVLRGALERAEAGTGRIVCVLGEPGIGKTTLVEDFLDEVMAPERNFLLARGHCSERLAGAEAYLPAMDALANLLRHDATGSVARVMKVIAPTWYAQLVPTPGDNSAESSPTERALSRHALVREFTSLLQEITRLAPLVLFIDDIHWADVSTVDLLAHIGRQCHDLRLLVVITGRPTELLLGPHPFHPVKLELMGKGACTELALGFLSRADIDRFLQLAFPGHAFPDAFADLVFARTEGSPLFIADLLRYLRERGELVECEGTWSLVGGLPDLQRDLPESIRSMIQRKLDRLDLDDRRLLGTASVQGPEFDSAVVADALGLDAATVEERLQWLERVHGLVRLVRESEFPDGTLTLRYAFVHVLYQQALYNGLTPSRRAKIGADLAKHLERHHSDRSNVVAAELACLYEVARDFAQAARQFHIAALNDARVFAHRQASTLARRGLRLLQRLPESPTRAAIELPLQTTLGMQLQITDGFAAPEAGQAYARARELLAQVPGPAPRFPVLWGHWLFCKVRSELSIAQRMAEELMALARELADSSLALQAHQALGITAFCRGEQAAAVRHVEQATALYDLKQHHTHSFLFGQDPAVICKAYGAVALWLLGFPEQAETLSERAIEASRALSPSSQAVAQHFAAMLHQLCGNPQRAGECAANSIMISAEHGFSFWSAGGHILGGWAQAVGGAAGGIEQMRQGLRDWQATSSVTYETYFLGLLAGVLIQRGQFDEASQVLQQALVLAERTGEGLYEPELLRLCGELDLARTRDTTQAETRFHQALALARRQQAQSLALRAAMSLTRLDRRYRGTLVRVFSQFTEGFETPDLRQARQLLAV